VITAELEGIHGLLNICWSLLVGSYKPEYVGVYFQTIEDLREKIVLGPQCACI
jgi:hypothetical protein